MTAHAPNHDQPPRNYFLEHGLTGPAVMKKVAARILEVEETLHGMVLDKRITSQDWNARALWLRSHLGGLRDQFTELAMNEENSKERKHFFAVAKRPAKRPAKRKARR